MSNVVHVSFKGEISDKKKVAKLEQLLYWVNDNHGCVNLDYSNECESEYKGMKYVEQSSVSEGEKVTTFTVIINKATENEN